MKLKSGIAFLFLTTGLLICSSAVAQTATKADSSQGKAAASQTKGNLGDGISSQTFTGAVVSVDGRSGRLTIKTWDNQQKQFLVDSMAALALKRTDSKLSDLKPGDQIIVTAQGNKAVSVSLSTTDLKGSMGNSPYRSQLGTSSAPSSADEAMKNQGVDPYRATIGGAQPAPPVAQGLRDVPLSSTQPTGLIAAASAPQAGAQTSTPASSPSAGASERTTEKVNGSVVNVEPAANLITVKTPEGHLRVFIVDFNTKYNLSSAASMLADLKEGQPITITAQGMKVLSVDTNTAAQ